jgi:hypothetical protein
MNSNTGEKCMFAEKEHEKNSFLYHFVFLNMPPLIICIVYDIFNHGGFNKAIDYIYIFMLLIGGFKIPLYSILSMGFYEKYRLCIFYFFIIFFKSAFSYIFYYLEKRKYKRFARIIDTTAVFIDTLYGIIIVMLS